MSRRAPRILLIEDDRDLAEGLEDALSHEGYTVAHAADGPAGLAQATSGTHDLVVLDAMLPSLSGFDLLKELRRRGHQVPVIMLTARGQEVDKVRGLKLGADDYVAKPFGVMELMARIEARLRHAPAETSPPVRLEAGDVIVDFRRREARWRRRAVALTAREFEILELLAARRGEAVSRNDLIARIWGTDDDVEVTTRTVDQHVASLRRKLGDDGQQPHLIETVYGFGYRLAT
jgi:DNA-binding response OmpR family regulator